MHIWSTQTDGIFYHYHFSYISRRKGARGPLEILNWSPDQELPDELLHWSLALAVREIFICHYSGIKLSNCVTRIQCFFYQNVFIHISGTITVRGLKLVWITPLTFSNIPSNFQLASSFCSRDINTTSLAYFIAPPPVVSLIRVSISTKNSITDPSVNPISNPIWDILDRFDRNFI